MFLCFLYPLKCSIALQSSFEMHKSTPWYPRSKQWINNYKTIFSDDDTFLLDSCYYFWPGSFIQAFRVTYLKERPEIIKICLVQIWVEHPSEQPGLVKSVPAHRKKMIFKVPSNTKHSMIKWSNALRHTRFLFWKNRTVTMQFLQMK